MKSALIILSCCIVSALSLARHGKPPATMAPAQGFSPKPDPTPTGKLTTPAANGTTGSVSTATSATTAPAPITNTTSPAPITNTTSPAPITNTTSPAPITNTTSPAPITNTTSPAPITKMTTAPPTMTPPKPNPPADLIAGDYRLMKGKIVCLMAHVALQLRLETPKASGTFVVQPNKTRAVGECQENRANLTLVFEEGFITFMFNKSSAENIAYVDTLLFNLTYPLSNASGHYAAANMSLRAFPAKIGHSYACRSDSVYMGNGLYLDVKDDRMQAFDLTPSGEFGVTDHCAADQPDYSVAIGVGVTLLVLILVVVVVYLLGRKRRTDGYQPL
ncbi:lysosome-associated membrane glycoprotein 3 isoform X2 [Syngnathus acus]|uniref:lysosome-associated membrane glycoprotein 3 isoform X2 n=1 Tax=Syngnathus acus TaxID=161584 RepID=UPI001885BE56|nr:lysosome-associated membrane glycoprotein 3 isoform X2 [Syngnathus acus]